MAPDDQPRHPLSQGDSPVQEYWEGGHSLLQGIQGLNPVISSFLHWQVALYQ